MLLSKSEESVTFIYMYNGTTGGGIQEVLSLFFYLRAGKKIESQFPSRPVHVSFQLPTHLPNRHVMLTFVPI